MNKREERTSHKQAVRSTRFWLGLCEWNLHSRKTGLVHLASNFGMLEEWDRQAKIRLPVFNAIGRQATKGKIRQGFELAFQILQASGKNASLFYRRIVTYEQLLSIFNSRIRLAEKSR
ncbi:hypothetical protein VNO78_38733 [Psophocarpus tetragonolobus]|uniref:Uncharacterized protein n=1 Tax=Psophocarpus tetragonolobus TaxID=3891 RepID=A0AAN9RGV6_PSOTE